jgi:hypothetical protein
MEQLVSDGVAVSDGQGGVVFAQPGPQGSSPGVQRQTAPASPRAPSGFSPATPTGFGPFEGLAQGLGKDLSGFGNDILASRTRLGLALDTTVAQVRNQAERELAVQEFRDLRLEHRKAEFLAEHHQASMISDDEEALEREVQEEVDRRLVELEARVNTRLDFIKGHLSAEQGGPDEQGPAGAGEPPVLEPDRYRSLVQGLFGDPGSPVPPDDMRYLGDLGPMSSAALLTVGQRATTEARSSAGSQPLGNVRSAAGSVLGGPLPGLTAPGIDQRALAASRFSPTAPSRVDIGGPRRMGGEALPAEGYGDLAAQLTSASSSPAAAAFGEVQAAAAFAQTFVPTAVTEVARGGDELAAPGVYAIGAADDQASVGPSGHEELDIEHLDLDELATRIYGRLRRRLRAELLIDRERAGLLTDFH